MYSDVLTTKITTLLTVLNVPTRNTGSTENSIQKSPKSSEKSKLIQFTLV